MISDVYEKKSLEYVRFLDGLIDATFSVGMVPYFEGPPGIGKTAYIRGYAQRNESVLIEVSVASLTDATALSGVDVPQIFRIDLRSLPSAKDRRFIEGLLKQFPSSELLSDSDREVGLPGLVNVPADFVLEIAKVTAGESEKKRPRVILFLDELSTATPDMQSVFQSLLLEGEIGSWRLPDSVRIIAAGNPPEMVPRGTEFFAALDRRIVRYQFPANIDFWAAGIRSKYVGKWIENRLNYSYGMGEAVISFLTDPKNRHLFIQKPESDDVDFDEKKDKKLCNPASWEQLIGRLSLYEEFCLENGHEPFVNHEIPEGQKRFLHNLIKCGIHESAVGLVKEHIGRTYCRPSLNAANFRETLERLPLNKKIHDAVIDEFFGSFKKLDDVRVLNDVSIDFTSLIRRKYEREGWDFSSVEKKAESFSRLLSLTRKIFAPGTPDKRAGHFSDSIDEESRNLLSVLSDDLSGRANLKNKDLFSDDELFTGRIRELEETVRIAMANNQVPILYGPPGVGKSEFFRRYAERNDHVFVKMDLSKFVLESGISGVKAPRTYDVDSSKPKVKETLLALKEMSGDPLANIHLENGGKVYVMETFIPPHFLDVLRSSVGAKKNVLLVVEELTNATENMMTVLMSLLYEKRIGGIRLPENVHIAATGNHPDQVPRGGLNFRAFDRRLVDLNFPVDFDYWCRNVGRQIEGDGQFAFELVRSYLSSSADRGVDPSNSATFNSNVHDGNNRNNPANWERVVRFVAACLNHPHRRQADEWIERFLSATLEKRTAASFFEYYRNSFNRSLTLIVEKGVQPDMPTRPDEVLALVTFGMERLRTLSETLSVTINLASKGGGGNRRLREGDKNMEQYSHGNFRNVKERFLTILNNMESVFDYYENLYRSDTVLNQHFRASQLLAAHQGLVRDIVNLYAGINGDKNPASTIPTFHSVANVKDNLKKMHDEIHHGQDTHARGGITIV